MIWAESASSRADWDLEVLAGWVIEDALPVGLLSLKEQDGHSEQACDACRADEEGGKRQGGADDSPGRLNLLDRLNLIENRGLGSSVGGRNA